MDLDIVIEKSQVYTPSGLEQIDVGIKAGKIVALGKTINKERAKRVLTLPNHVTLPGAIDSQVHFREPGLTHKEDIAHGSRAAVLGGVTTFFEMPNTNPPTTTRERLADKLAIASETSLANFGFFVGAGGDKAPWHEFEVLEGCAGIKVFMGSSTGTLLVDDETQLIHVLKHGRYPISVHCEDETRLRQRKDTVIRDGDVSSHTDWRDKQAALIATARLLRLARDYSRPVHVLHVSTAEEMELLAEHRDIATVEVTPQHLTLTAEEAYSKIGSRAQMNPPLRDAENQKALWRAVNSGLVDVLGSDHAPHTLDEKAKSYPDSPSGMPGVQTLLPIMLDHVSKHHLSLARLVDLTGSGPARIFNLRTKGRIGLGMDADLAIVNTEREQVLKDEDMASKCRWTPFHGRKVRGVVTHTVVMGTLVVEDGRIISEVPGKAVKLDRRGDL